MYLRLQNYEFGTNVYRLVFRYKISLPTKSTKVNHVCIWCLCVVCTCRHRHARAQSYVDIRVSLSVPWDLFCLELRSWSKAFSAFERFWIQIPRWTYCFRFILIMPPPLCVFVSCNNCNKLIFCLNIII